MSRPIRLVTLLLMLFLIAGCSSDDGADNEPARSDEIEVLIEGYLASWEAKDEQALRASVTDGFIINEYHYSLKGGLVEVVNDDADGIVSVGFAWDWQNEIVGEAIWEGDGPWIVAYREHWEQKGTQYDGIATYVVIVDDDGTLKIANHHWAGIDWFED
jgi:hypothetical protein